MSRFRPIGACTWLFLAVAGLFLLGASSLKGAPQDKSLTQSNFLSSRADSAKAKWHSGPASTPPQTEVVQPPSLIPPPAKPPLTASQARRKKAGSTKQGTSSPAGSAVVTQRTSAPVLEPTSAPDASSHSPNSPDPEAARLLDELNQVRADPSARRAFYDDLRRTIEHVRAGVPDDDERQPAPSRPASPSFHRFSSEPAGPPSSIEPHAFSAPNPGAPQASGHGNGKSIDRAAYLRVVRWAKANGAPVPLALGVAWMESHLHTDPPRGAAGEIGMFQILPERCRLEGWPARRLSDPQFNAWLGTLLLARYYREEGSWAGAAAKYVAGPGVFDKSYSDDMWAYINRYANSVDSYAAYFSRYPS